MRPQHFPGGGLFWFWQLGMMALLLVGTVVLVMWLLKRRKPGPPGHAGPPWAGPPWQAAQPAGPAAQPGHPAPPGPRSSALQILDERLAGGDIDVDDYLTRRAALTGDRPHGTVFRPAADPGGQPDADEPTA